MLSTLVLNERIPVLVRAVTLVAVTGSLDAVVVNVNSPPELGVIVISAPLNVVMFGVAMLVLTSNSGALINTLPIPDLPKFISVWTPLPILIVPIESLLNKLAMPPLPTEVVIEPPATVKFPLI